MLHRRFAHAYAGALAFALAFGASGLPSTSTALAKEGASAVAQAKATGADTHSAAIRAQSELPATFDLRDRGVVTPVKDQGGWGTCWTFGVSAAAETSVLSSMGTTYEGYKSATGLDLDFSERHLAYFALSPITSAQDPEQGGEGMAVLGHEYYPNAPFEGGHFCYATSLFASGAGPTLEKEYPYRGRRALTMAKTYEYLTANEREAKGTFGLVDMNLRYEAADSLATSFEGFIEGVAKRMGRSVDGFYDYVYDRMSEDAETQVGKTPTLYNTADDWSIPERDAAGLFNRNHTAGWVLKNGNILSIVDLSAKTFYMSTNG